MAEEEILTEHVVSPKKAKDGSGGSPMIIIVVVVAALAIVAFFLVKQMGGVKQDVKANIDILTREQRNTQNKLAGKLEIKECNEKSEPKGKVVMLTSADGKVSEPVILNLADGHYIRTKISICVEAEVPEEEITSQKDALIWAVTEVFNRKTVDDIISIKGGAGSAAEKPAGEESGLMDEENLDISMPVAKGSKLNALRSDIMASFSSFGSLKISDVYLPELVVDVE